MGKMTKGLLKTIMFDITENFVFFAHAQEKLKKKKECQRTLAHLLVAAFGGWASPITSKSANLPFFNSFNYVNFQRQITFNNNKNN